jgi:hypothetical protein
VVVVVVMRKFASCLVRKKLLEFAWKLDRLLDHLTTLLPPIGMLLKTKNFLDLDFNPKPDSMNLNSFSVLVF